MRIRTGSIAVQVTGGAARQTALRPAGKLGATDRRYRQPYDNQHDGVSFACALANGEFAGPGVNI